MAKQEIPQEIPKEILRETPWPGAASEAADGNIYVIHSPARQTVPLVFSSPHSGRRYSADFIASARLDEHTLRRSEDSYIDELFGAAPSLGAPLIAATFPRAFCDVNREAWELDPGMFEDALPEWVNTTSARVGAGLGTIARVVANGEAIYGIRLRFSEAERRVRHYWQPYHDALAGLIADTRAKFGVCVLVDCHSMPAGATAGRRPPPDFVVGDANGSACALPLIRAAEAFLRGRNFLVTRNDPYAGGYVTRHYGRPREAVHALQIEVARGLYMDEATLVRRAGFARLQRDLTEWIECLTEAARGLAMEL
jgi:N-formylglutamate deformylase